jgi:putative FmdB family regulatory protein
MPLYEYECKNCSNVFTVRKPLEKLDEGEKCPRCQSLNTKRLISQTIGLSKGCNINFQSGG